MASISIPGATINFNNTDTVTFRVSKSGNCVYNVSATAVIPPQAPFRLSGLTLDNCEQINSFDNIVSAFGKLQCQINAISSGGTGTVTSVDADDLIPLFTSSVGFPTTTPTISFARISQNQNLFYASPDGSAGLPTFRAIVANDLGSGADNTKFLRGDMTWQVPGGGGVDEFIELIDAPSSYTASAFDFPMVNGAETGLVFGNILGATNIVTVDVASTGNLVLSGNQTINGVVNPTTVLAWQQTTDSENGAWTTAAGAWTRMTNADSAAELNDEVVFVTGGTQYKKRYFNQIETVVTVNTDPVNYQINAIAGNGAAGIYWAQAGNSNVQTNNKLGSINNKTVRLFSNNVFRGSWDTSGNLNWGTAAQFVVNASGRLTKYDNAAPTNGQILIGDTAAGYFKTASLTAGANITITPGAGTISIAAASGAPAGTSTQTLRYDVTNTLVANSILTNDGTSVTVNTGAAATQAILRVQNTTAFSDMFVTNATPEAAITATRGAIAFVDTGAIGAAYLKISGAGNTGWAQVFAITGTSSQTLRFDSGGILVANSVLTNDGTTVSVNGTGAGNIFQVQTSGSIKIFQMNDSSGWSLGYNATPGNVNDVIIGANAQASPFCIAIGSGASALGGDIAMGPSTSASQLCAEAFGQFVSATGKGAIAMGGSNQGAWGNDIQGSYMLGLTSDASSIAAKQTLFVYNTTNILLENRFALATANFESHIDKIATNTITISNGYQPVSAISVTSVTSSTGALFNYSSTLSLVTGDYVITTGFGVYSNQGYFLRIFSTTTAKLYTTRPNALTDTSPVAFISNDTGTITPQPRSPVTVVANAIQIFSKDTDDAATSLALLIEQAVATETVTSDRTLKVTINGVQYKLCLKV